MKRHRFIRILFMLPVLLCVASWGLSYVFEAGVWHESSGMSFPPSTPSMSGSWGVEVCLGKAYLMWSDNSGMPGWGWAMDRRDPGSGLEYLDNRGVGFLGFRKGTMGGAHASWFVSMPLWFATALSTVALFFVWRKTRPKVNPKMAFPVEPAKPTTEWSSKAI